MPTRDPHRSLEDELHAVLSDTSHLLPEDPASACALAERLLRECPGHPVATLQLAAGLARLGLAGEALPQFRSALRADGRLAAMPWAETLEAGADGPSAWIGEFAEASCPCCGGAAAEPIWAGTLADRVPGAQHLDALRTWARCAGCGLVRVLRPPSDAALQTYEAAAAVGAHAPGPLPPDEARLHAALLRHEQLLLRVRATLGTGVPGRPLRLLDIGSGWGDRLAAAKWAGFEVVGVEPDPRRRRWMERRLGPLPVVESLAELDAEPFDLVLFGGCVEEEDEGILLLDGLGSLLADDGLLVLHVDLLDHPVHRMRGYDDPIWARPNRRIWFERRTLTESLQVVGLAERAAWSDEQQPGGTWVLAGRAA
jgi:hypothetical protein